VRWLVVGLADVVDRSCSMKSEFDFVDSIPLNRIAGLSATVDGSIAALSRRALWDGDRAMKMYRMLGGMKEGKSYLTNLETLMPEMQEHAPGTFCWVELATTDVQAGLTYYQGLFGWGVKAMPLGEGAVYYMVQLHGKDVGAIYELLELQRQQGELPHWLSYVSVTSVDETLQKAKQEGGTVLRGPSDIQDAGRMALIQDPTGAKFAIWEPWNHCGAGIINEPGAFCWNELATRNEEVAGQFYSNVFGWEQDVQKIGGYHYTTFLNEGKPAGGMLHINDGGNDISPHWMVYFSVEDCDASAEKAQDLGGTVNVTPTDVPLIGRFSVLTDPQGAVFSIIKLLS